jgi:hypothetical protein
MMSRNAIALLIVAGVMMISCEKDFFVDLKTSDQQLVVEAYINNELPLGNYVVLTHSQNYYDTTVQSLPVTGALVFITEGQLDADGTIVWDASSKKKLTESDIPSVPGGAVPGVYIDSMAFLNPAQALMGKPGKHYLLEIDTKGGNYTAITSLPKPVLLDSVSSGNYFIDSIYRKARLTLYYQDPDTIGNTQLFYWRNSFNHSKSFGWGSYGSNRFLPGTDDLTNGQYITVTPNNGFIIEDTVHYSLVSVERQVYNFWDSFARARDNAGPFATPVKLASTIKGENVVGCFSGFSLSTKTIVVK